MIMIMQAKREETIMEIKAVMTLGWPCYFDPACYCQSLNRSRSPETCPCDPFDGDVWAWQLVTLTW